MLKIDSFDIISKSLIFKQLHPPTNYYLPRFKYYITRFIIPSPTKTTLERLEEHIRYNDNGNIIFNKWFYKRPTEYHIKKYLKEKIQRKIKRRKLYKNKI